MGRPVSPGVDHEMRLRRTDASGFTLIEVVIGLALLGIAIGGTMTVLQRGVRSISEARAESNAARLASDWSDRAVAFGCGLTTGAVRSVEAEATCGSWQIPAPAATGNLLGDFRLQEQRNGMIFTVSAIHDFVQVQDSGFVPGSPGIRSRCDVDLTRPPDALRRRVVVTWTDPKTDLLYNRVFTSIISLPADVAAYNDISRGAALVRNLPPGAQDLSSTAAATQIANRTIGDVTVTFALPIAELGDGTGGPSPEVVFDGPGQNCVWIPFLDPSASPVTVDFFPGSRTCLISDGVTTAC